jgi:hypothetical protein
MGIAGHEEISERHLNELHIVDVCFRLMKIKLRAATLH